MRLLRIQLSIAEFMKNRMAVTTEMTRESSCVRQGIITNMMISVIALLEARESNTAESEALTTGKAYSTEKLRRKIAVMTAEMDTGVVVVRKLCTAKQRRKIVVMTAEMDTGVVVVRRLCIGIRKVIAVMGAVQDMVAVVKKSFVSQFIASLCVVSQFTVLL